MIHFRPIEIYQPPYQGRPREMLGTLIGAALLMSAILGVWLFWLALEAVTP